MTTGKSRSWKTTKTRHGTHSGWALHQELNERPCDPCYQAKATYDRRRKDAPEVTRRSRVSAKAQQRAYGELARLYPDVYRALYQQHKADLLAAETG